MYLPDGDGVATRGTAAELDAAESGTNSSHVGELHVELILKFVTKLPHVLSAPKSGMVQGQNGCLFPQISATVRSAHVSIRV
jgi:hypothetical protein